MKTAQTVVATALMSALLCAGVARAADDPIDAPEVTIGAAGHPQGLYMRTDLSYAPWRNEGDPSVSLFDTAAAGFNNDRFGHADVERPISGGVGIGYQFSDLVRADVTGEYFSGRFDADGQLAFPCDGDASGTTCGTGLKSDYRAIGLMANGYVDLATLAGFTPYAGAGVGATHVRFSDVSLSTACIAGTGVCTGVSDGTASYSGESSWRFTYALTAGVSYDVSERVKLDVSYRYSHIASGVVIDSARARVSDDGLSRHELRAGLRLSLY